MEGYGEWGWIHLREQEPVLTAKWAGLHGDGVVCLPPEFMRQLNSTRLLDRMNRRFDTCLDRFEEEDISSPAAVCFFAGSVEESFRGHELQGLADQLVTLLLEAAASGRCVTFRF